MWAAVVLALMSVCAAQVPMPCATPKQWEARRFRFDRKMNYTEFAKHTYDAVEQRTRTIEEVEAGTQREFYDTIHLYKLQVEYKLNLRTRKCNVTKLERPFREIAVPPNSIFDFTAEEGPSQLPGEHFTFQEWQGNFTDGTRYYISVTSPSCVPIAFDAFNKDEHFLERYFDLREGIPDPEEFIPPSECLTP